MRARVAIEIAHKLSSAKMKLANCSFSHNSVDNGNPFHRRMMRIK